jgi:hypothetical protein
MCKQHYILAGALAALFSVIIVAQSQTNRSQPQESCGCGIKPAYLEMLRLPEWARANELHSHLLKIRRGSVVTSGQKEGLYLILMGMGDGARKPDAGLVRKLTEDFTRAVSKARLDAYLKAGLSIEMEIAMRGVNDDYLPNMTLASGEISLILEGGGVGRRLAGATEDDLHAIVKAARN